jgi:hypothetical protein
MTDNHLSKEKQLVKIPTMAEKHPLLSPRTLLGYKIAYFEAEKVAELALTVLQTGCLFSVRSPPSEDPAQRGLKDNLLQTLLDT